MIMRRVLHQAIFSLDEFDWLGQAERVPDTDLIPLRRSNHGGPKLKDALRRAGGAAAIW
jgi:hypothetical protein